MTEIDVPDWVVKAAYEAGDEFAKTHTMSMYASLADRQRDCVRHMLTAALGAWVVPESVQFQDPDGKQWWSFNGPESCRYAESLLWPKRTLYALRQEKPE